MKEFLAYKQAIKSLESEYLRYSSSYSLQRLGDLDSSLKQAKKYK